MPVRRRTLEVFQRQRLDLWSDRKVEHRDRQLPDNALSSEYVRQDILRHMKVGPSKAAQLARVARSTIYKDIVEGKLSAEQDGKGHRVIDVSELERVYGELNTPDNGETSDNVLAGQVRTDEKDKSDSALQREVDFLRERLAEKDERLHEKDMTIEDLRGERDRLLMIVEEHAGTVRLLTDERAEKQYRKRRSWRLWGGS